MAVISISNAQLAFGHVALLDGAEFSLESGERVGLIGRNGTGKSSLLKTISGVSKLDDGLLVMQQGLKTGKRGRTGAARAGTPRTPPPRR